MNKHFMPDLSRRSFLVATAAVGGGLMIGYAPVARAEQQKGPPITPSAYIHIDTQGKVNIISPMIEMGQGTYTSLPMLVAEELDVDMANVTYGISPPSDSLYGNSALGYTQITGGSTSVRAFFVPLRETGAAARAMLIAAAAAKWGVKPDALATEPGFVVDPAGDRRLSYGELADEAAKLPVPANAPLKKPDQFRIIGTPVKRLDAMAKGNGTAVYGIDTNVPGMKIATIAASPVFGGKLASERELTVWMTDDARRLPVKLEAAFLFGNVTAQAVEYRRGMQASR